MAIPAMLGAAIIGGVSNTANNAMQIGMDALQNHLNRKFQSQEAQKNRNFQEQMRDTSYISTVNQAKELGISPSLLLGHGTTQLGGSSPSGGSSVSSHLQNPLASSVNQVIDMLKQDRQYDAMERLQDKKLDTLKEMQDDRLRTMYPSVTAKNKMADDYKNTNFTKDFLNNLFTNLDDVNV